jgi:hypothetical protein
MPPSLAVLLAAALLAAAPGEADETYASLPALPMDQIEGVLFDALAPAPTTIVRQTKYFGTVTIDHRAHLARKAHCKACHGTGAITKMALGPKLAHERCIGCHAAKDKGPTACNGCHVRPPPPAPTTELASVSEGGAAAAPKPREPNAANVSAALAAFDTPRPAVEARREFRTAVEVGLAASHGYGASVRLTSRQEFFVLSQSIEQLRANDEARTLGLVGAGVSHAVHPRLTVDTVGLVGFDVFDKPVVALFPALGLRTGIEWRSRDRFIQQLTCSVTGVVDIGHRSAGQEIGGGALYVTLGTGFRL